MAIRLWESVHLSCNISRFLPACLQNIFVTSETAFILKMCSLTGHHRQLQKLQQGSNKKPSQTNKHTALHGHQLPSDEADGHSMIISGNKRHTGAQTKHWILWFYKPSYQRLVKGEPISPTSGSHGNHWFLANAGWKFSCKLQWGSEKVLSFTLPSAIDHLSRRTQAIYVCVCIYIFSADKISMCMYVYIV